MIRAIHAPLYVFMLNEERFMLRIISKSFPIFLILIVLLSMSGCYQNVSASNKLSDEDSQLISRSYYEDQVSALFYNNAFNAESNLVDIYSTTWYLEILDALQSKLPDKDLLYLKTSMKDNLNDANINKIYDTYLKVETEKQVNPNLPDKLYYVKTLLLNQGSDGLFFFNNNQDNLDSKIAATTIALQTFYILNYYPKELNITKNRIIELFLDDNNFNQQNIKDNLVNRGIPIIDCLVFLKYNIGSCNSIVLNKRKAWLTYWIQALNNIISNNITLKDILPINDIINNVYIASHFLNVDFKISDIYLNILQNILGDEGIIKINNEVEPQATYYAIRVMQIANMNLLFKEKLSSYVISKFNYGWDNYKNNFNLKDNYYGLLIAKKYNIYFNKSKMYNYIQLYLTSNINDLNIEDIYFYCKTLQELDNEEEIQTNNIIWYRLNDLQSSLDKNNVNNIKNVYYLILIYKCHGLDPVKSIHNQLIVDVKNKIKAYNKLNEEDLFYCVMIARQLNLDFQQEAISKYINKFYSPVDGGYVPNTSINMPNIYSTFRMVQLQQIMHYSIDQNIKNNGKNFVGNLHSPKGGFFLTKPNDKNDVNNYRSNFTLEGFYDGLVLISSR